MTTTIIKSGLVSIEDGRKSQTEFEPARKVRVELSFDVPDDQEPTSILDSVAKIVSAKVDELLGRTTAPKEPARRTRKAADEAPAPAPDPAPAKPADDLDASLGLGAGPVKAAGPAQVDLEDLLGEAPKPAEEKPITDAELNDAVVKTVQKLGQPRVGEVKAIIFSYGPTGGPPFHVKQIPVEKRREFTGKLAGLK